MANRSEGRHKDAGECLGLDFILESINRILYLVNYATVSPTKTVLLVDDRDDFRITAKWFLDTFGYAVDSVRTAEEALAVFDPRIHDIVLTDNSMPGMSGGEMAHVIKLRSPSTPIVMHTGMPPQDRSCLDLVIEKPTHMLKLKEALDTLLPK